MNIEKTLPKGDDPLFVEFAALWATTSTHHRNRFIVWIAEAEVKRKVHTIVLGQFILLVTLIVVAQVTNRDGMATGLSILLGVEFGLVLAIVAGTIMHGKK
jgi:hypothetical protein